MITDEEKLAGLRERINAIDSEILECIGDRNDHVAAAMSVKKKLGLPVWDQKRVDQIIDRYVEELGDDIDGIKIATAIIGTQKQLEDLDDI